eukprot:1698270-Prymnesium_polylepis.1
MRQRFGVPRLAKLFGRRARRDAEEVVQRAAERREDGKHGGASVQEEPQHGQGAAVAASWLQLVAPRPEGVAAPRALCR